MLGTRNEMLKTATKICFVTLVFFISNFFLLYIYFTFRYTKRSTISTYRPFSNLTLFLCMCLCMYVPLGVCMCVCVFINRSVFLYNPLHIARCTNSSLLLLFIYVTIILFAYPTTQVFKKLRSIKFRSIVILI